MDKNQIMSLKSSFDEIAQIVEEEKIEYWFARDLMTLLGYSKWENFEIAVKRAMESCQSVGIQMDNHFRGVRKMIQLGKGGQRAIQDYMPAF